MPLKKAKHGFLDLRDPFFKPLWRRVVTFSVCFGWGLIEFMFSNVIWGTLFCGVGLLAGYIFFVAEEPASGE